IRATPPSRRMSAGTRSSAITATAPASSAILAWSGVTTSMMTPPLSICASPTRVLQVEVCRFPFSIGCPPLPPPRCRAAGLFPIGLVHCSIGGHMKAGKSQMEWSNVVGLRDLGAGLTPRLTPDDVAGDDDALDVRGALVDLQ